MYNGQFRTGKVPNYIDGVSNISKTGSLIEPIYPAIFIGLYPGIQCRTNFTA